MKEIDSFKIYFELILAMSNHNNLIPCLLELEQCYKPHQIDSIFSLFGKLNEQASVFMTININKDDKSIKSGSSGTKETNPAFETANLIVKIYKQVENNLIKSDYYKAKQLSDKKDYTKMSMPEAYKYLMKGAIFGTTDMKSEDGKTYDHRHYKKFKDNNSSDSKKMTRLAQEIATFSKSLPVESTNACFIRADSERIDVMKAIIFGAEGTPYANGAFEFHTYFGPDYPNSPPHFLINTTGTTGDVRFNPNLYSDNESERGKVC